MLGTARRWCLLTAVASLALALSGEQLAAHLDSANYLHISAPNFHFLKGKPLERLKDGATVAFLGQLSLSTDANVTFATRVITRFAMSYDIWEERFSITRFGTARNEPLTRTASHLSSEAAELWCLDHITVDASAVPSGRPFWVRFELRAEDGHENTQVIGEPGINITRLIEIFSRPARAQQQHWQLDAGPLRLSDLRGAS